jgi:hypothetical protein
VPRDVEKVSIDQCIYSIRLQRCNAAGGCHVASGLFASLPNRLSHLCPVFEERLVQV